MPARCLEDHWRTTGAHLKCYETCAAFVYSENPHADNTIVTICSLSAFAIEACYDSRDERPERQATADMRREPGPERRDAKEKRERERERERGRERKEKREATHEKNEATETG